MLGTRDLLCWCHEHLGRDADSPALRGRQDSRLPVEGAVRDVTCETIGMDDERAPPSTSARSRKAREAVVQSTSTVRQGGNALVGRNDLAPKPDPENRLGRAKSAMMLEIEATTYLKTTSRRFATRA